jgi:hypothetical protein
MNTQPTSTSFASFTAPTISAVSIASASMMVELSISTWAARKLDKRASEDITAQNYAAKGVANVNKKLLGECAELDAVQKFASNARTSHYFSTMPWTDSGMRLLPTAQYFKYHQQMTALQAEFTRLVEQFLAAYNWEVTQAQAKLGDLFNVSEYPNVDDLRDKFKFKFTYIPVAPDWRVDIAEQAQRDLAEQYEAAFTSQVTSAMNDMWNKLHGNLAALVRQLDVDADGKKGRLYQSILDKANDLTDMLETFNITGDPVMQLAARKLKNVLNGVTIEDLKDDEGFRADTKRALDEVIKSLPSFDL